MNLHRLPDSLDLESAALTEPLACAVHGVMDTAQVRAGDRVAITGPVPIGHLALQLAKAAGASVVMLGTNADTARLELSTWLGADGTLNLQQVASPVEAVADLLGDTADLVIECSGAAQTLLERVGRGGRYWQLGLYGRPVMLDLASSATKSWS